MSEASINAQQSCADGSETCATEEFLVQAPEDASSSSSSSTPLAVIIAPIVAGVVLLAIIMAAIIVIRRRQTAQVKTMAVTGVQQTQTVEQRV